MLSNTEIKSLSSFLNEDIKTLNLAPAEIPERANQYLENIAGLEFLSPQQHQKLIQQILDKAKSPST